MVRATKPLLNPLRKVIPGLGGLDLASLVLAVLLQWLLMIVVVLLMGANPLGALPQLLVWSVISITSLFLKVFFFAMIISVILSWVSPAATTPAPSW